MRRVSQHNYRQALDLIPRARDCGDASVVEACRLVLQNYIIARPVPRTTLALITTFADD